MEKNKTNCGTLEHERLINAIHNVSPALISPSQLVPKPMLLSQSWPGLPVQIFSSPPSCLHAPRCAYSHHRMIKPPSEFIGSLSTTFSSLASILCSGGVRKGGLSHIRQAAVTFFCAKCGWALIVRCQSICQREDGDLCPENNQTP